MKIVRSIAISVLALSLTSLAAAQTANGELRLEFDPAQSVAAITLPTTFHTVEGTFRLKRGSATYDPATGKAAGEIVFDATSGNTGNGSRDHKMHKDILESERYPELVFRPDRVEGSFSNGGTSKLKVHGAFVIHGVEHEVEAQAQLTIANGRWSAEAAFPVPYQKWGMKNPSTLMLRAADTVQVQLHAAGSIAP
jgi:polyisoprenoid-binding protein YceI